MVNCFCLQQTIRHSSYQEKNYNKPLLLTETTIQLDGKITKQSEKRPLNINYIVCKRHFLLQVCSCNL